MTVKDVSFSTLQHRLTDFFLSTKSWWFCFFGLMIVSFFLRLLNTQHTYNLSRYCGYALSSALIFAFNAYLWNYGKKFFILFLATVTLYEAADYLRIFNGMIISERETMQTLSVASILFGVISLFLYLGKTTPQKFIRILANIIAFGSSIIIYLSPLTFLGYYAVSGGKILSADIIMTLFQTNKNEVLDYISEQNQWLWWISTACLFFGTLFFSVWGLKLKNCRRNCRKTVIVSTLLLFYLAIFSLPRLQLNLVLSTFTNVNSYLTNFAEFEKSVTEREQYLQKLQGTLSSKSHGIYILVLGEATTRDHLHAYGYDRLNTPWLDSQKNNPQALIFRNAYSNHVHTIPALLYLLTQQSQHNDLKLKDTYSIIELAKTAGFATFWLSNQTKFSAHDTPLTILAQYADNEIWINDYSGEKSVSAYTDEKLVEFLPDLVKKSDKSLIIIHLMGCHSIYADRYPAEFEVFSDRSEKVNSYDNCILHNDNVLAQLYNSVKNEPDFMSLIYVADHGEEPDLDYAHESSKFTFQMSRIPLVMLFSEKFITQNKQIFDTLKSHTENYWSSDLMFETMLDILGIDGFSRDIDLSLASPQYNRTPDNLYTLHGKIPLSQDK